jgi:hypothetical protein
MASRPTRRVRSLGDLASETSSSGGALALVQTMNRRIDLVVSEEELGRRTALLTPPTILPIFAG